MSSPAQRDLTGERPEWLTFDCYGTLIQWDEGLIAAVERILARTGSRVSAGTFMAVHDRHEHRLEQERPHRSFRDVSARALALAMTELSLPLDEGDAEILISSIGRMPPFPEVVPTLSKLKGAGYKLAIISNTDDEIIAGNVAQLEGRIDRVITAQQAQAYKPSAQMFRHAWKSIGTGPGRLVHICASPHLDLAAAHDLGFRAVWVDRGTGRRPLIDYQPNAVVAALDGVLPLFSRAGWL
ncbi:MAG TPA: haloacid dehalogenase type II [Steroidobacteraceae bacterium]|jgi:2-haloacid dehalogenase/putative hydrolase of the HAD superfamily|nr:haloacid dehalogenase type II [Steroidobacteraceae bacterium]